MSVKVQQLSKIYGTQRAIDSISFEAHKGEVLGFLGPNGAGKTTTMKIVTCFIPQSEGVAEVCGYDTAKNPMEVRRQIGYLPEHNPLYKDMYVKEYLDFVAGLHHVPNKSKRIAEMVERTGLGREQHKLISSLSKGYRQRVGLAQAMLHDPEVLILDEPTSGLDPNQLVEIRKLIKDLGKEKTVIFSTHIMQEVQALCDKVLIINRGQIVANDSIDRLQDLVIGETTVTVEFLTQLSKIQLERMRHAIPSITQIEHLSDKRWVIRSAQTDDTRAAIFNFSVKENLVLLEMHREVSSVEDIFTQLTS
jgi:ABC-2 type transport system ATP-binding protein